MARFSRTASILASALFFLATNAAPLETSMPPELAEASPIMELISTSQQPDFPVESPNLEFPFPSPSQDFPTESPVMELLTASPINEGCVAIEHLQGYKLQHAQHLRRRVLCTERFCATPNHAIIVDGVMTSMKRLCAGDWSCVTTERLVNNLNLFANRRAEITDRITVTPYDIRFPRWCTWIVQAMECVWNMTSTSSALLAAAICFMAAMTQNKRIFNLL